MKRIFLILLSLLLLLLLPASSSFTRTIVSLVAPPTKVALSTVGTSTFSTTCTISDFDVGTANKLIIGISAEDDTAISDPTSVAADSCTGETKAVSIAYTPITYSQYAAIYYCDNPVSNPTDDITIEFTNVIGGIVCAAISFSGVESGAPSDTDTATDTDSDVVVTVTSPGGNSLFFSVPSHHDGDCSSPCWTPTPSGIEEWDAKAGDQVTGAGGYEVVASGSESHEWDCNGTTGYRIVGAGAVW